MKTTWFDACNYALQVLQVSAQILDVFKHGRHSETSWLMKMMVPSLANGHHTNL